jgi:hypothetical protein
MGGLVDPNVPSILAKAVSPPLQFEKPKISTEKLGLNDKQDENFDPKWAATRNIKLSSQ